MGYTILLLILCYAVLVWYLSLLPPPSLFIVTRWSRLVHVLPAAYNNVPYRHEKYHRVVPTAGTVREMHGLGKIELLGWIHTYITTPAAPGLDARDMAHHSCHTQKEGADDISARGTDQTTGQNRRAGRREGRGRDGREREIGLVGCGRVGTKHLHPPPRALQNISSSSSSSPLLSPTHPRPSCHHCSPSSAR